MLRQSKNFNENYAAKIARVDAIEEIPGANSIVRATLGESKVVVSKDTQVGDIVVFFPVGSAINKKFLSTNNLFSNPESNSNYSEYKELKEAIKIAEGDTTDTPTSNKALAEMKKKLKGMTGMFDKHGRVKLLSLRGVYSEGFVASVEMLESTWPELRSEIWSARLGVLFDMVGEDVLCTKYIPVIQSRAKQNSSTHSAQSDSFDRIIPDTFKFHYDTTMLDNHIDCIDPADEITITVKVHGTSAILANIPVRKKLPWWKKMGKKLGIKVNETEYDYIYSSRRVIQNQYGNVESKAGDVYAALHRELGKIVPKDTIIYGELVGYIEGTNTGIQQPCGIVHDYGCQPGEWAFMPYRIVTTVGDNDLEWSVKEVHDWTLETIETLPQEQRKLLIPINILYSGKAGDMYNSFYKATQQDLQDDFNADIDKYCNTPGVDHLPLHLTSIGEYMKHRWRIEWMEDMKNDDVLLRIESPEPMCNNPKVPREGVVIRLTKDTRPRAFKLKSKAHYALSDKSANKGEADPEDLA